MSKELSPELQAQIEQEADALSNKGSNNNDYENGIQHGLYSGYQDGATKYALLLQSEQEKRKEVDKLIWRLADTLRTIQEWKLPATGQYWDKEETQPMSYEAAYGTNGARDFMRDLANIALTQYNNYKAKKDADRKTT